MIVRYIKTTVDSDGNPSGIHGKYSWGRVGMQWGNEIIVKVELDDVQFAEIQQTPGLTILPSLNTPAGRLPSPILAWLANHGIVPAAGDSVLNILRAIRDKMGLTFRELDISTKE